MSFISSSKDRRVNILKDTRHIFKIFFLFIIVALKAPFVLVPLAFAPPSALADQLDDLDQEREYELIDCRGDFSSDCVTRRTHLKRTASEYYYLSTSGQLEADEFELLARHNIFLDTWHYAEDGEILDASATEGGADFENIFLNGSRDEISDLIKAPIALGTILEPGVSGGGKGGLNSVRSLNKGDVPEVYNGRPGNAADTTNRTFDLSKVDPPEGRTFEGTIYRYENPDRVDTTFTAHPGNVNANHRYSVPGEGAVYGGTSSQTAAREVEHYGVSDGRVLAQQDIRLDNVLDLNDPNVRNQIGVRLDDISGDSYQYTHQLGTWAREQGYDGILAPSARNPSGSNIVVLQP